MINRKESEGHFSFFFFWVNSNGEIGILLATWRMNMILY